MKHHEIITLTLCFFLLTTIETSVPTSSSAQRTGEQAEMDRLEQQANNLASQDDPEGAALAIGKAAMMADLLTKESKNSSVWNIYQSASLLYRAQELGFRALALFERSGSAPPAPAGVCQYLEQGQIKIARSRDLLEQTPVNSTDTDPVQQNEFLEKNEEWKDLLQDLHVDFECTDISKH